MLSNGDIILVKIKEELNNRYGEGNWKLRLVSRARKESDIPSLTITEELAKLGIKPRDWVVVAIDGDKIVITKT